MKTKLVIYLLAALSLSVPVYVWAQTATQRTTKPVFYDDFEYDVARSAKNAEATFRAHGWSDVKANNYHF